MPVLRSPERRRPPLLLVLAAWFGVAVMPLPAGAAPAVTVISAPDAPVRLEKVKLLNTDASPMVLLYAAVNGADAPQPPEVVVDLPSHLPDGYVPDDDAKLDIYRRLARAASSDDIDGLAAELRDRVRAELESKQDGDSADLIAAALAGLDRAPISTIHAFALSLLRIFAAEAGIDPAFEVQDEVAAERRFEERWRTYLEGLVNDPAVPGVQNGEGV